MQLKNKILCVFFTISVLASCDQVEQFVSLQFKNELILSPEMEKRIPVVVITPKTYEDDGNIEKEYPVVYLLHGYSGDQNQWKKITNLPAIADKYDVLLVCPDAGFLACIRLFPGGFDILQNVPGNFESVLCRLVVRIPLQRLFKGRDRVTVGS